MRHVIIQCSMAQNFKANGTNGYCNNLKRNQKSFEMYIFMKSRSNNSNKAENPMFEAKTVMNYSSMETGCELCLQRLRYKSTEKLFKKTKAQKPKIVFENGCFKK